MKKAEKQRRAMKRRNKANHKLSQLMADAQKRNESGMSGVYRRFRNYR